MSERIHALAQLLFGKSSVEECSVDEIKDLANQYPYFAPAQFLLLQKLKESASPEAEAQQRKAILYYHDPLQFGYFLSADKFYIDESVLSQKKQAIVANTEPEIENKQTVEEKIPERENFVSADATEVTHDEALTQPAEELDRDAGQENETAEPDTVVQEANDEPIELPAEDTLPLMEETDTKEEKFQPALAAEETGLPTDEPSAEASATSELTEPVVENTPLPETETASPSHATNTSRPGHANGEAPLFEPYHTVDYFASQGIKITGDDIPKDKLGKQLRSFTEWLKMMKRLPASEMDKTPESASEKNVESMANYSVAESEVVTEAMAEVWAKQGAREKAAETYNKLSLLNPSKRAYFAAKIENLKGS